MSAHEAIMTICFIAALGVCILLNKDNIDLRNNSENAACLKRFNQEMRSVEVQESRKVYHKEDRPNRIVITCGE